MAVRILLLSFLGDFCHSLRYGLFHLCLIVLELFACLLLCLSNHRSHILHIFKESHAESFARKFLAAVHGPVSVLEIVVLHAAELLDVAVATVVVGHEKSL